MNLPSWIIQIFFHTFSWTYVLYKAQVTEGREREFSNKSTCDTQMIMS